MESRALAIVALIAALFATPAAAQRVIDGDTIDLNGTRWRLWGIDAPETHQACADGWPAGLEATAAMGRLMEGKAVVCEFRAATTATSVRSAYAELVARIWARPW
jgi:endonuclease YncB( thermonuclease family)